MNHEQQSTVQVIRLSSVKANKASSTSSLRSTLLRIQARPFDMATLRFVFTIPGTGFHVAGEGSSRGFGGGNAGNPLAAGRAPPPRRQLIRSGRRGATAHAPLPRSPALLFLLSLFRPSSFPVHNARKHNRFAVRSPPPLLSDRQDEHETCTRPQGTQEGGGD